MTTSEKVKRDFDQAMKNREARVATIAGESIRNALDLLDEQPAAGLELIIEHTKVLQVPGQAPKHRFKLRAAIIEYLEERLHEAREREHQLAQAITGADGLPSD